MANYSDNKEFIKTIITPLTEPSLPTDLLDQVIEWITYKFYPEDIFSKKDLQKWAEENGYVKSESN